MAKIETTKSTGAILRKRVKYEERTDVFPDLKIFDNWAKEEFLYCRHNRKGNAITPLEMSTLSVFPPPSNGNIFALDFVVDAFTDMRNHYVTNIANQRINGLKGLDDLVATRGYKKSISLYISHVEDLKNILFEKYLIPNRSKIRSFKTFLTQFFKFVRNEAPSIPILYSSFVVSAYCPIQSTGLTVEVIDEDHNLNSQKYKMMFDRNFNFFSNMAHTFGFVVARHAPWMFVANLDSKALHEYIENYDMAAPNIDKVIDQYFYECRDFDIDILKQMMYDSYYELLANSRYKTDLSICNDRVVERNLVDKAQTLEQLNSKYTKYGWLDMYFKILLAEKDMNINSQQYKSFYSQCKYIYDRKGFNSAVNFFEMRVLKTKGDAYR